MPEKQAEIPKIPKGLKAAGRKFWREIHETYQFVHSPELVMLVEEAARTIDVVVRLQSIVDNASTLRTSGSRGQDVAIPELDALRAYRAQFASLVKQLDLPAVDTGRDNPGGPLSRSEAGRIAASARWSH
ncbi:hypothetical protein [Mycolicibacter kumamotonensis]|uniref:hypothetical protein n=1 Tax=Mycolicibacter kumamotonensis TaxID=354243 RepID=UPI001F1E3C79|nr:hypothetical protein [Mycolicibacter kumamotonensis]